MTLTAGCFGGPLHFGGNVASPIMKYFEYAHLPAKLQEVSEPICVLAQAMDCVLLDGPEKSAGLRKLLEAKDCFVRARIEQC